MWAKFKEKFEFLMSKESSSTVAEATYWMNQYKILCSIMVEALEKSSSVVWPGNIVDIPQRNHRVVGFQIANDDPVNPFSDIEWFKSVTTERITVDHVDAKLMICCMASILRMVDNGTFKIRRRDHEKFIKELETWRVSLESWQNNHGGGS